MPSPSAILQAQELEWATSAAGRVSGLGIATDILGNSHITGRFGGTAIFGEGEDNETELASDESDDIFVAKYDPAGRLLWATSAGGSDFDQGLAIAIDASGKSFITGFFIGTVIFGGGEGNETELTSAEGTSDIFVAKFDPAGRLLWATSAGGSGREVGQGIAVDAAGNSHITGPFRGTVVFGEGEDNETELTSANGNIDTFVAKYDPAGRLLWATSASTSGTGNIPFGLQGRAIAIDAAGNSHVTGGFFERATFGAGEDNETELTSAGWGDVFVAKYDPAGKLLWARSAGGMHPDRDIAAGSGIAVEAVGNSLVTGSFVETVTFGAGEDNETELTAFTEPDIFIAKYDPAGRLLWAKSAGGNDHTDSSGGIGVDAAGNSHITGQFVRRATFGLGEANQTTIFPSEEIDAFVARYDPNGALLWVTSAGGPLSDPFTAFGRGIGVDAAGNSFVTGEFDGTATFGAGDHATVLVGGGMFLAKYGAGAGEDSDGDGVLDEVDFCPGTALPEAVPTRGRLLPLHFAITDEGPAFSTGTLPHRKLQRFVEDVFERQRAKRPWTRFTVFDTRGCSCEQIIEHLGLGKGHRKHGCSLGVMRRFIKMLPE